MAGYSGTPLIKKLGIKENFSVLLLHPPENYSELIGEFPQNVKISFDKKFPYEQKFDFIHLFVSDRKNLANEISEAKNFLSKSGMLWVSWTKKSSEKFSGITEDMIRDIALETGLVDVKVCAVDEDWSGLKLVYRIAVRE